MNAYLSSGDRVVGVGMKEGTVMGDSLGHLQFHREDRVTIAWDDGAVTTVIAGWVEPVENVGGEI